VRAVCNRRSGLVRSGELGRNLVRWRLRWPSPNYNALAKYEPVVLIDDCQRLVLARDPLLFLSPAGRRGFAGDLLAAFFGEGSGAGLAAD
jgi:hypothetical protein